jgi:hypothetical protein
METNTINNGLTKLSIFFSTNHIHYWWSNFLKSININENNRYPLPYDYYQLQYEKITNEVAKHGAKYIYHIEKTRVENIFVEFDSEHDAVLFLMKFS